MEIWLGTTNKGKIAEMSALLSRELPDFKIQSLSDLPHYIQPPENGKTFLENARIKARSVKAMKPGQWSLAEDSGLEVEGLGGLPGIHSARYAGPHARDSENVAKLLKMMQLKAVANRNARFHCALIAFSPEGTEHILEGNLSGTIAKAPAGQMGFGYDPVFVPNGEQKTLAELGLAYKNKMSHRAKAIEALIALIKAQP